MLRRKRAAVPIGYLYKPFDERQLRATLALAQQRKGVTARLTDDASESA